MRRHDLRVTTGFTWEPEDDPLGESFEFELCCTIEPYDPGDYTTPPCGGGVADLSATLYSIRDAHNIPRVFSDTERMGIEARFHRLYETDAVFSEQIESVLFDEANRLAERCDDEWEAKVP